MSHIPPHTDSASFTPVDDILIVTDNPQSVFDITSSFKGNFQSVSVLHFDGEKLQNEISQTPRAILFLFHDYMEALSNIVTDLRSRFSDPAIPFVGALSHRAHAENLALDTIIYPPFHPEQMNARINAMIRVSKMETEVTRRIATLREDFGFSYTPRPVDQKDGFRILFVGQASPKFMVLMNSVQTANIEVMGAFTPFTAFDYLHEFDFDGVVLNLADGLEPAFTIAETMRRNSRLYHVPTLFLAPADFDPGKADMMKGVTDFIPDWYRGDQIKSRILELARFHRFHRHVTSEFGFLTYPECTDQKSQTFNAEFLRAHIKRTQHDMKAKNKPLSLMTIQLRPQNIDDLDYNRLITACDQAGKMIKNMVRMEDFVARYADNIYVIACFEQTRDRLKPIEERLQSVFANSVFNTGKEAPSYFNMSLDILISEMNLDDSPNHALSKMIASYKTASISDERLTA